MEKKKKKQCAIFIFQLHNQTASCSPWEHTEGTAAFKHRWQSKGMCRPASTPKKARPVMYLTVCVVVVSWAFMFITCSSTNGLHLSTEVSLCTGTSNVARGISSELSVCNSVCSFLVNAQSLQRFEGISSYFGILANFNFSSTNQICGSQGSRSLWQEKTCF